MASQDFQSALEGIERPLQKWDACKVLSIFGYNAAESGEWPSDVAPGQENPTLKINWWGSYEKDSHKYFILDCQVVDPNGKEYNRWRTARRVSEFREKLHARLKEINETAVDLDKNLPIPVIGAKEVLSLWFSQMGEYANTGKLTPHMLAVFLLFLAERPVDLPFLAYLKQYGYLAASASKWCDVPPSADGESSSQILQIAVDGHHEEDGHTRYHINVSLKPPTDRVRVVEIGTDGNDDRTTPSLEWTVNRRLKQIREEWYDVIPEMWPESSIKLEEGFAWRGGIPGTTSKLNTWAMDIARSINLKQAPPTLVAHTLAFLEAPPVSERALYDRPIQWDMRGTGTGGYYASTRDFRSQHLLPMPSSTES